MYVIFINNLYIRTHVYIRKYKIYDKCALAGLITPLFCHKTSKKHFQLVFVSRTEQLQEA
jgi:hypothetical protein